MLEIDIPEVLSELVATFEAYEQALGANDIETLNRLFWTIRQPCATAPASPSVSTAMRRSPRSEQGGEP